MGVKLASERPGFSEMEDVNLTDSELVYHVRDALRSVTLGDSNSYNELIGVIHHTEYLTPDEVALLVTSLKALSGAVSCIDIAHHDSLLSSIFRMSMWSYGPDVMDALVELIISLVCEYHVMPAMLFVGLFLIIFLLFELQAASSGKYIDSCLDMLVSNFMPPHYFLALLKQPRGLARKDQVLHRVHSALRDIADLVPLAPLRLLPIVLQKMPNVYSKEPMIVIYVENMLRLESGAMGELVGSMILCAVVDRLIDLDVEIEWEDILQDDFSKGIFEMELEDVEETLDDDEQEGDEVFETLLQSFKQTVMKAHKSKFSQFVMFYACSLDPGNCGVRFADILADIFTGSVSPPDVR
ncbi:RNA polymerase I specific transcription initiation factor RRN3 protein [Actinidia rufa]|uniref:RNA polymerase I specific transcription initiation factor RRN3 protein n=1 Tax=Actinidia rufa TaxID=165716 RepID=A0A7J0DP22_9ERIC|nr:RNA polymerase I specific transcription initiation factor RRN3 protein [Actinidia rufa]